MAVRRGLMAQRIQRAFRKYRLRRRIGMGKRKGYQIQKVLGRPGEPTFVETFNGGALLAAGGHVFKVRMSDIPQVNQYMNLYTQYRINWVKVILVPDYNTQSADPNVAAFNQASGTGATWIGAVRIVHSIQDSPNVVAPISEGDVLQDNGAKIKSLGTKWSCSFKPVPDVAVTAPTGAPIYTRQKFRQWFNYDGVTTGNNPEHGAVCAWITQPGAAGGGGTEPFPLKLNVYYKVNFSLRDPK